MREKIFMVGGSKGGVGKSIVCTALIDYLTAIRNAIWRRRYSQMFSEVVV